MVAASQVRDGKGVSLLLLGRRTKTGSNLELRARLIVACDPFVHWKSAISFQTYGARCALTSHARVRHSVRLQIIFGYSVTSARQRICFRSHPQRGCQRLQARWEAEKKKRLKGEFTQLVTDISLLFFVVLLFLSRGCTLVLSTWDMSKLKRRAGEHTNGNWHLHSWTSRACEACVTR